MVVKKPTPNPARGSGSKPSSARQMRSKPAAAPKAEAQVAPGEAMGKALGTAVGAAIDTAVGFVAGIAAKSAASGKKAEVKLVAMIDQAKEEAYWKSKYKGRPYYRKGAPYSEYEPAYRFGIQNAMKNSSKMFEDHMDKMEAGWKKIQGRTTLSWEHAKDAVRDAWERASGK